MKSILIPFMLLTVVACASSNPALKNNESVQLMDGSYLYIEGGKAVRIADSTGEPVAVKKGAMMELANGDFVYVKRDGSVNKIETDSHAHKHDSNAVSGHSH